VAVDDEQYRLWVASRWGGVELEGDRAVHRLLSSGVEYRRMDAFGLDRLDEGSLSVQSRPVKPFALKFVVFLGWHHQGGSCLWRSRGCLREVRRPPAMPTESGFCFVRAGAQPYLGPRPSGWLRGPAT
jgi:hypothetical protein